MQGRPPEKLLRRQLAVRRTVMKDGQLTPDGRLLIFLLKKACHAAAGDRLVVLDDKGAIDTVATACAAARREIYDEFVRLLNLDNYTTTNITREEE